MSFSMTIRLHRAKFNAYAAGIGRLALKKGKIRAIPQL
jgi:hypothetical protein